MDRSAFSRRWLGPIFAPALLISIATSNAIAVWEASTVDRSRHMAAKRAAITDQLLNLQGRHLVLVGDGDGYAFLQDWIYNGADIDGSRIVWAHGDHEEQVEQLVTYFAGRQVWRIEASQAGIELLPFSNSTRNDERRPGGLDMRGREER